MVDGSIVLVAKCPIPGKSKTRLIPLLGQDGSTALASAMLSDILQNITFLRQSVLGPNIQLILLFAPCEGRSSLESLLNDLHISSHWTLLPMITGNLESSNLGDKLTDALIQARTEQQQAGLRGGPVVFLGMDSPETPLDELEAVFTNESSLSSAVLCPAEDGGYGLLSVPPSIAPLVVFAGVRWSQSLTAASQLKALSDAEVLTRIGRLMYDIDVPSDVHALVRRLQSPQATLVETSKEGEEEDALLRSSVGSKQIRNGDCPRTKQVLKDFGFLKGA